MNGVSGMNGASGMNGMRRQSGGTLRTLAGGAAAAAGLSGLALASNALGLLRLDFGRLVGTFLAPDSARTRRLGWSLNLVNGALLALGYGEVFRRLRLWPGAPAGALLGLAHGAGATALVAALPQIHPRPRQAGLRPMSVDAYGPLTLPGMLLGHVLYGALVGWLLERESRRASVVSPAFLAWLKAQEAAEQAAPGQPAALLHRLAVLRGGREEAPGPAPWGKRDAPARAA